MLSSEIILRPIITEKSMLLAEQENKYTFSVDKRANKIQIKKAIEELFNVTVVKVNTMKTTPKKKRVGQYTGFKPAVAKAVVTLAEGSKIEIFNA
ncbi:50S ribosomal protein L23 [Candidatus Xianfuyuplasma coldseepsis]|uniref:Large ribosomal subunit protein uL23 n=1 Tax=Candidatus Xianfuyuplasma coldseepsis TaxID=2782163 RepID=A0A7L7KQT6_9MOLU|nr:50S ribosomal protein L23 [Xianfuyuplasma coldseepsis]QMS85181.1 50S ribosomal protein L23 [Xianfuyuplasma coldseepsis]